MLAKFPRIIGAVVFGLVCLTWLFRGQSGRLHAPAHNNLPIIQQPHEPLAAPDQQKPERVHYADLPVPATTTESAIPAPTGSPMLFRKTPFAYVFYATKDEYACSALINIERLRHFRTPHRIFAFVTDKVTKEYVEAMETQNVTVSVTPIPTHPHPRSNPKEGSLLKLYAFKMHQIEHDLRRVIVLDADQYIYHPIDSLFNLPSTDLAAPRAYWKGDHFISTSLMVISLSDRLWTEVETAMGKLKDSEFDFDLINQVFESTAMLLPGQYGAQDSHFVDWDLPKWFRPEGDLHREGMVKEYSKAKLEDLWEVLQINSGGDKAPQPAKEEKKEEQWAPTDVPAPHKLKKRQELKVDDDLKDEDLGEILTPEEAEKEKQKAKAEEEKNAAAKAAEDKTKASDPSIESKPKQPDPPHPDSNAHADSPPSTPAQAAAAPSKPASPPTVPSAPAKPKAPEQPPPYPYQPGTHPNRGALGELHSQFVVMHYSKLFKPWEKNIESFKNDFPKVFPGMYMGHQQWRADAQKFCPRIKKPNSADKVAGGAPEFEFFHFVNNV
ncbi:nucleotide-diphospho-sugar transferase [Microthyrium microscopicum]|uniref:Nucleotide-diphospho-sugar transferase n=1 Tax=Microthyrium microscopicum TaxID=703497 RepID=A0A6A6U693_9PEZI|nr:nucleotide-diphospho-sugar transferase [Microthyrium microscopicum]